MLNKDVLKKVYNCYKEFIETNKYNPSYEQVCEATGLSLSYVSLLVTELVKQGYLKRPRDRIITLTEKELE